MAQPVLELTVVLELPLFSMVEVTQETPKVSSHHKYYPLWPQNLTNVTVPYRILIKGNIILLIY